MEMSPSRRKEGEGSTRLLFKDPQSKLYARVTALTPQLYNLDQSTPSFPFPSSQGLQLPATSMPRPSQTLRSN